MYFQVEDVYKKFSLLDSMEQNSWTMKAPTPKKRKVSKVHYSYYVRLVVYSYI